MRLYKADTGVVKQMAVRYAVKSGFVGEKIEVPCKNGTSIL